MAERGAVRSPQSAVHSPQSTQAAHPITIPIVVDSSSIWLGEYAEQRPTRENQPNPGEIAYAAGTGGRGNYAPGWPEAYRTLHYITSPPAPADPPQPHKQNLRFLLLLFSLFFVLFFNALSRLLAGQAIVLLA